jgi:putative DNA primase/helicase
MSARIDADALKAGAWPEPQPLVAEDAARPYPVGALPGAIGEAVREVTDFVQCPAALAACSALSALSTAAQGLANIRRGPDLEGPLSLYLLAVADSGERKSECDRRFSQALRDWEGDARAGLEPERARSRAAIAGWEEERQGVRAAIRKARTEGKPTDKHKASLAKLEEEEPQPVREPHLLIESETAESLAWALARPDGWPSAGLLSSEAGIVFGGHAMRRDSIAYNLSLLNKLWSGEPHRVSRRTSESFELSGARLTMGLAVQPETVRAFFEESRGLARGTGFAARFLIAWPISRQGERLYREPPANWPGLTAYRARLRELLDAPAPVDDRGALRPPALEMTSEGFEEWKLTHDSIERELRTGGEWAELRDVASKAAENVARVAGLLHVFTHGPRGRVDADCVHRGAEIVRWHLGEAQRFLGGLAVPAAVANAIRLDAWLVATCRASGRAGCTRREVQNRGPNPTRHKVALEAALAELVAADRAMVSDDRRTVLVNPALLAP